MKKYSIEKLNHFWNADAVWNIYLHESCMLHIAGRTGWLEHLAAGSPPSTAHPAAHHSPPPFYLFSFSLPQRCDWSWILQAHISYQKHPAVGHCETRVGCQIPGRQLGSARIPMWRRWKLLDALPASPSLSVNDEHLRWGMGTVKIANCNNKSFHQMLCTMLRNFPSHCRNLFKLFFYKPTLDQCVGWAPVTAVPETAWLKRRLLCCQTIFLSLLCSGSSVSASNFSSCFSSLLLWGELFLCMQYSSNSWQLLVPARIFKGFWHLFAFFCVYAHCERDVWVSDFLIGNAMKKLKCDPDKELAWEFAWDFW